MTPEERLTFVAGPRTAVFSTLTPAGRIHAVPVWYRWDGERFRVITGRDSAKVRNLRANPRASLCIDDREGGVMRYVTARALCRSTNL